MRAARAQIDAGGAWGGATSERRVARPSPHTPPPPPLTTPHTQLCVRAVAAERAPPSATTGQPYGRVFNFSAGPACLPLDVLEEAQADLLNWKGSGERGGGWGFEGVGGLSSCSAVAGGRASALRRVRVRHCLAAPVPSTPC